LDAIRSNRSSRPHALDAKTAKRMIGRALALDEAAALLDRL
jgi:hypothetical protein